jgi:hypothetical protein
LVENGEEEVGEVLETKPASPRQIKTNIHVIKTAATRFQLRLIEAARRFPTKINRGGPPFGIPEYETQIHVAQRMV